MVTLFELEERHSGGMDWHETKARYDRVHTDAGDRLDGEEIQHRQLAQSIKERIYTCLFAAWTIVKQKGWSLDTLQVWTLGNQRFYNRPVWSLQRMILFDTHKQRLDFGLDVCGSEHFFTLCCLRLTQLDELFSSFTMNQICCSECQPVSLHK